MSLMRENCLANSYDSGPPVTSAGAPSRGTITPAKSKKGQKSAR